MKAASIIVHDLMPTIGTASPPKPIPLPASATGNWGGTALAEWLIHTPAYAMLPDPIRRGKLAAMNASEYVVAYRLSDIDQTSRVRDAIAAGLVYGIGAWDSSLCLAVNEDGTRAALIREY